MAHLHAGRNIALIACGSEERARDDWPRVFVTRGTGDHEIRNIRRKIDYVFPLYLYPGVGKTEGSLPGSWPKGKAGRAPNLDPGLVAKLEGVSGLRFISDGYGGIVEEFGPEDVLAWIYAVFHSTEWRRRKAGLEPDLLHVPLPGSVDLFRGLAYAGLELLGLHLLESPELSRPITSYTGPGNPGVGRVGWSGRTVWLDAGKTNARAGHRATIPGAVGFRGVPEEVWDFRVGGRQVCRSWLADRKGLTLSDAEIAHYQKIVVSVSETIAIMEMIDALIESGGGRAGAFRPQ